MAEIEQTFYSPLDDQDLWLNSPAFTPPLSGPELASVQKELDSIIGTTRDNHSIATIVWNGDTRYWKQFYDDWDMYGKPIGGLKKRPWVLYMSIYDASGRFVRDSFPPRYLVLTRLEPEQYVDVWESSISFYEPIRSRMVQYKPSEPPKEYFMWFQTISHHHTGCCQVAAQNDVDCYGFYAHPRSVLEDFRRIRKCMEADKLPENYPFDSPDQISARIRERMTNNYAEQAMEKYLTKASFLLDEAPLTMANKSLLEESASRAKIRAQVSDALKRGADNLEKQLKERGAI